MGQYYKPALVQLGEVKVFDRTVKPECEYVMAKLTVYLTNEIKKVMLSLWRC